MKRLSTPSSKPVTWRRFVLRTLALAALCFVGAGAAVADHDEDGKGYNLNHPRTVTPADAGKPIHLRVGEHIDVALPDNEPEISWASNAEENFRVEDGKPLHLWTVPQKRGEERGDPKKGHGEDRFMYRARRHGKQDLVFEFGNGNQKMSRTVTFHFVIDRK